MRVEIIGGLGVGKTTLCKAFTHLGLRCVHEDLAHNPYLNLAYRDPDSYGFYAQLSFYLGNFFTIRENTIPDDLTIFDFSTITDRAYANLFLHGKARDIAFETIDHLTEKEGRADLYLYLTCSPETQIGRIRQRNRNHESGVTLSFVQELESHIHRHVLRAVELGALVRAIDTEKFDLLHDSVFVADLGRNLISGSISATTAMELHAQYAA